MASTKDLRQQVGQLFLVGFDGQSVSNDFKRFVQDYHVGGVIYFKRNLGSPEQIAELSNELQFSCRTKDMPPLLISIDHEGGEITRLGKPFTKFPGNNFLGELNSPKVGFEFGIVIAKELKAVGINVDFAPVVDVNSNPNSPIIKNRAFSSDPEACGRLGSAVCRGIQKVGVMAVAKHFPGHGDTKEDSHFSLPRVGRSYAELDERELIPFKRVIRSRVEGIMTAHILNEALDAEFPATLSEKTIEGLLRRDLRFSRLVFADDMEMKAISDHYGPEQAAVLAVKAGCDVLIYCGTTPPEGAIDAVVTALQKKEIPMEKLERALARIASAKRAYCDQRSPLDVNTVTKFIGLPEHAALAEAISRKELPKGMSEDSGD